MPLPPESARPAGSIYCVDGVIAPYYNYDKIPKRFSDCKEIMDCLSAHEMSHVADANRSSPGLCKKGPLHWLIGTNPMAVTFPNDAPESGGYSELVNSEFRAHTAELYCLMAKLKSMNGRCDEKCKAAVVERIRQITRGSIPGLKDGTCWDH